MQHKYVEEFQRNAMIEFQKLRETLENEMDDRFVSQDEIIDSTISNFNDVSKDEIENCFNLSVKIDSEIIKKKLEDI